MISITARADSRGRRSEAVRTELSSGPQSPLKEAHEVCSSQNYAKQRGKTGTRVGLERTEDDQMLGGKAVGARHTMAAMPSRKKRP